MTKQLRYLFMLLLSMMVSAHVFAADNLITEQVTINVATAGTLSSKIPKADKYRITNLKLTGELNVEDIKFIRQMASYYYDNCKDNGNLQHLDLGGAKFVGEGEFTVSYGGGRTAKFSSNVVGDYVFCALKVLQSIVLPDGLQLIRDRAFLSCSGLSSVTLPNGLQTIGEAAFLGCKSLSSVTLPDGLQTIGKEAFADCYSLSSVSFPDGLQTIDYEAFWDCTSLSSVSLPDGLQTIGEEAFKYCSSLTSVSLPEGLQTIGSSAFYGCSSLSSVSLPEGLKTIGSHAFYNCSSLTSVFLPDGLQTIDYSAFEGCSSLTSVSLPEGLQTIGASAFKYCESLTSVYANMKVPAQMEQYTFGDNTTQNATLFVPVGYIYTYMNSKWKCFKNIKEFGTLNTDDLITNQVAVNVEAAGTLRSKIAIEDKFRITNLKLTGELNVDDIMLIREMAGCYYNDNGDKYDGHLQHLDLSGAKFVGGGEFAVYDGSNSNTAKFTNNAVGDYVFYALESLKTIALYDDLKEFGSSAFACCKNLTSVSFPRLLTKIKDSAFVGCSSLTSVSFPKILTEIGGSAFAGCSSLISVIADMKIPAKIEENTFDTETVLDATLYVPQGCIEKYENADYWRYFQVIKEIGTQTGIDSATTSDDVKEVARYGINGQLQNGPTNGVNIVKYSDGTTKRVMVK